MKLLHLLFCISAMYGLSAQSQTSKSYVQGDCSASISGSNNTIIINRCGMTKAEFAELRQLLTKATGNSRSVAETMRLLRSIDTKQNVEQEMLTGGDSYAYIDVLIGPDDLAIPAINYVGKYPLHSLTSSMVYLSLYGYLLVNHDYRDVHLGFNHQLEELEFSARGHEQMHFRIHFNALNGGWTEELLLRKTDGEWHQAFRVSRPDADDKNWHVVKQYADPKFPRDVKGEPDWDEFLRRPKAEDEADVKYGFPFLHVVKH